MMKKSTLVLIAGCLAMAAQARTLRVNNISGMAPYASIQAAVDAALDGDTIMVDGSTVRYEGAKLDKRLVLIGPGYLMNENGLSASLTEAIIDSNLEIQKEGTVLTGLRINDRFSVLAPKAVITRCRISYEAIKFSSDANNSIIHQNLFSLSGVAIDFAKSQNHQVTNNLFKDMSIEKAHNSYIAFNTNYGTSGSWPSVSGASNRVEKNIVHREDWIDNNDNTYTDNYIVSDFGHFSNTSTDKDVKERTFQLPEGVAETYGAFAGTDPYVLSGIPAGPVIEALTVPASVEEGSKLNVTIKLGLQK